MDIDFLKRHLAGEMKSFKSHSLNPEEENIVSGHHDIERIVSLIKRILGIRPA